MSLNQYRRVTLLAIDHEKNIKLEHVRDDGGLNIYGPHYLVSYRAEGLPCRSRFASYASAKELFDDLTRRPRVGNPSGVAPDVPQGDR